MEFMDRLKQLREEKGLTQEELSKIIGVSDELINDFESGLEDDPYMSVLRKLREYFDVTYDYLVGDSDVRRGDNE